MKKQNFVTWIRFFVQKKTAYIYNDIADIKTTFNTSNYELEGPMLKRKTKKVIGLMKDELGRKVMTKFFLLRVKDFSYLIHGCSKDEKAKGTKKSVSKRKLKFKNYKNCIEATQLDNQIKYLERNKTGINGITEIIKNS